MPPAKWLDAMPDYPWAGDEGRSPPAPEPKAKLYLQGTKVVNLWGEPGAGKSTTRAGLFYLMKQLGLRVEEVTEYAKDLTYRRDEESLASQLHVLGGQDARQRRLVGKVDWIITDSPLPLSVVYADPAEYSPWFLQAALGAYNRYDNVDFMIRRAKPFADYGRSQTEQEARALIPKIETVFREATKGRPWGVWQIDGNSAAPGTIADLLGLLDPKEYDGMPPA